MACLQQCWLDGRLRPLGALRADDVAFSDELGCFTTTRVAAGRPTRAEVHVQRLCRDAARLGLGPLDAARCRRALEELAVAAFGGGDGIVRLQAMRDGEGELHLAALPRGLPLPKSEWTAIVAPQPHPGDAQPCAGAKTTGRLYCALAQQAAREAGADEAILLDAAGRMVEGATTNLFAVGPDGALVTPPLSRGPVAGIARAIVCQRVPAVCERDVRAGDALCELIAVNAVRGAVPIVRLDGRSVGDGRPGAFSRQLAQALERD